MKLLVIIDLPTPDEGVPPQFSAVPALILAANQLAEPIENSALPIHAKISGLGSGSGEYWLLP